MLFPLCKLHFDKAALRKCALSRYFEPPSCWYHFRSTIYLLPGSTAPFSFLYRRGVCLRYICIVYVIYCMLCFIEIYLLNWSWCFARRTLTLIVFGGRGGRGGGNRNETQNSFNKTNIPVWSWYFNKMVLQNTMRSDVSAILKSIHVREIVRMGEAMIDR